MMLFLKRFLYCVTKEIRDILINTHIVFLYGVSEREEVLTMYSTVKIPLSIMAFGVMFFWVEGRR
jgi:hypothetical protein